MKDIENAFHKYFDDTIIEINETKGSQNNVFLIKTDKNKYIVKQFTNVDNNVLKERKEQLRISKIWNDNGIPCIQPLTDIFECEDNYYIIYPYLEGLNLDEGDLNLEQIKKLAHLQAKIHSLKIDTFLPSHIKYLDYNNPAIQTIIDECNNSVEIAKKELCVCDNDFKPLNIVWHDNNPYILDFDAVCKNHPTFSLIESAYTFCHKDSELNLDYYKEYINEYKKEYKEELKDIDAAIYGSWNGKIQWIKYLEENKPEDPGIKDLINQIINYQKYIEEIKQILRS